MSARRRAFAPGNSYFADPASLMSRTRSMVSTATKVDWTVVQNEVEALQLVLLDQGVRPRFNIKYRDDKSYPGWRSPCRRSSAGGRPGGEAQGHPLLRSLLPRLGDSGDGRPVARVFPMRSCRPGVFKNHKQLGRPCLLGYIGKCSAPCIGG